MMMFLSSKFFTNICVTHKKIYIYKKEKSDGTVVSWTRFSVPNAGSTTFYSLTISYKAPKFNSFSGALITKSKSTGFPRFYRL